MTVAFPHQVPAPAPTVSLTPKAIASMLQPRQPKKPVAAAVTAAATTAQLAAQRSVLDPKTIAEANNSWAESLLGPSANSPKQVWSL